MSVMLMFTTDTCSSKYVIYICWVGTMQQMDCYLAGHRVERDSLPWVIVKISKLS